MNERIAPPDSLQQLMAETDLDEAMQLLRQMAAATGAPDVRQSTKRDTNLASAIRVPEEDWPVVDSSAIGSDLDSESAKRQSGDPEDASRLRRVEARYRALVEQIPAITFMASLDESGTELYVSPHIETMLGFTQDEWLGDPFLWYRQLHPDDRQRWQDEFAQTCLTGKGFKSQYRFLSRDNREVWVHGEATIVRDDEGLPAFLHGIAFDITESKRAEQVLLNARSELECQVRQRTDQLREAHKRISAVLESAVDAIITIDSRGKIESANEATERLFGYSMDEVIGQNVRMLMPEPYQSQHDGYLRRYLETGEKHIIGIGREVVGRRKDGSEFPMHLAVSEVQLGDSRLFTGIVRDITAQKTAQQQLANQAADLEQKNRELFSLKEEAEQANVAKSQFLANMSHELRTPMNAIIGYSELLMEELEDVNQTEFLPDLGRIRTAGKHLLDLINDILDLSKIEAGKMEVFAEDFELTPFLNEVVATAQPLVDKKGNSLSVDFCDQIGRVYTDQTKIRQILFNLLSNAAKFTEKGQITVATRLVESVDGPWIELEVRDTGIGMTGEQMQMVFEAFSQAEASTTRRFGGTGLGLTITKSFCEMLGGELSVESEAEIGSRFVAKFPARHGSAGAVDAATGKSELEDADDTPPVKEVLIVDDDSNARDLLERYLQKEGYATVTAATGKQAIKLARERRPILITLDVMMPGLDGWNVLGQLKDDPATHEIPVVMISMVDGAEMGFSLGVMDFLTKPPDRARLKAILNQVRDADSPGYILIVDDDLNNRKMLRSLLKKTGYELREAGNGREALACITQSPPDLILLDLMMPVMDGFEVVAELKRLGLTKRVPVVVLTAKDLTNAERTQLQTQVRQIHNKVGISRDELLKEIKSYLMHHC